LPLSKDQVKHVAHLARVGITEEDVERFRHQLSDVLDYFERLDRVDIEGVPPTSHTLPLHNVMREDETEPSYDVDDILANAPNQEERRFRVRAILEE
jgi:aspartyl-tRNA(Asn)/glutamyl-tRNA(Gln) amidotransferase subunit C